MKKSIITVSREFGSGGRTIGKTVAQRLGIPYYDKELVKQVALESGFDPKYIEEQGSLPPARPLCLLLFGPGRPRCHGRHDRRRLFVDHPAQRHSGPGRQGSLCHRGPLRRLHSEGPHRLSAHLYPRQHGLPCPPHRAAVRRVGGGPGERLQDKDARRRINYKHYTDREWGMSQNYHVCLDSSVLGIDKCVDIILDLAENCPDTTE